MPEAMGQFVAALALAAALAFYSAVIFAIWKIFQIGRELNEIKALLFQIRREIQRPGPPPV